MNTTPPVRELAFEVTPEIGTVSALFARPADAWCMAALAHGAGAGMRHPFMASVAAALAAHGVATFRYQFPYMEAGRRLPDRPAPLVATVRAAVDVARATAPELPLIAGGKSLGGRMTSTAFSAAPLPDVRGLVFLGFPLHPAGRAGTKRAEHLAHVEAPMLFLQGTRDKLADLPLITSVCESLGPGAHMHVIEGADHGFHVLKRSGRSDDDVVQELVSTIVAWARGVAE